MKKIRILHMYSDMLDLYGDNGNIEVLKYRSELRGIKCETQHHSVGKNGTDFTSYDIIYLGGGADFEQQLLADDLQKNSEMIKAAYQNKTFFLLICGGYQLMGKYYKDSNGKKIPGLGLFDYYTVASSNKGKRCIGNIIIDAELDGKESRIIGFENHGGQTENVKSPFGKIVFGSGNKFSSKHEGYREENVIATYLHGPLLSKNPVLADHVIKYCIKRQTGSSPHLKPLNDELEEKAREVMFKRLLNK